MQPLTTLNIIKGENDDENDESVPETAVTRRSSVNRIDSFISEFESYIILSYDAYLLGINSSNLVNQHTSEDIITDDFIQYILSSSHVME